MLDRPVADAAPGVELVRSGEGVGRAGVQTSRAGAAMIGDVRRVGHQFEVDEQGPEEREAPRACGR